MSAAQDIRKAKFESAFSSVRDELVDIYARHNMPPECVEWYKTNLDYNVPGGKLNRGMAVVDTIEILKGRPLDENEYYKAAVLGWCVELLQAFFLIPDDIVDGSITRRGQPCYYRLPQVGMIAINDSCMLEDAVYRLLKAHFRREPYYIELMELFHDVTYRTEMGQLVDLITAPEDNVDLSKFSLERRAHKLIVTYKTAYYSFYLPVALAMRMCGVPESYNVPSSSNPGTDESVQPYKIAESILIQLGEYFQIQDDFLDYAGTPEQLGKIGTDILDNKCSWVINTAILLATPEQRKVLDDNYGRKDGICEARVKKVFHEIGIPKVYEEYEETVVGKLRGQIAEIVEVDGGLKRDVFESFLMKVYKRTK